MSVSVVVKYRKVSEDPAIDPHQAHEGEDAGADLTLQKCKSVDGNTETWGTGIQVEIPPGYCGFLMARSSLQKWNRMLANNVGLIDSGYRGEIMCKLVPVDANRRVPPVEELVGQRAVQLVIMPVPAVKFVAQTEELDQTSQRGEHGFGSTGTK